MRNSLKKDNRKDIRHELFDLYHQQVFRTAYYMTKDRDLAQEVSQETFVKALEKLDSLKNEQKVGSWLTMIATNTAKDMLKSKKRWGEIPTEDVFLGNKSVTNEMAVSLEEQVERNETQGQVLGQINQLNEEDKQVIILKYIHELQEKEIAKLLGMKLGTVKTRLRRARKKLKIMLLESEYFTGGEENG